MTTLINNIRFAIRQLRMSPEFTCVAVLTLGLCIGANLTIFSVLDAILVRSLPFPDPNRLVVINNAHPGAGIERGDASIVNYCDADNVMRRAERDSALVITPDTFFSINLLRSLDVRDAHILTIACTVCFSPNQRRIS